MSRKGWRDRYGVWNVEDKSPVPNPVFWQEVDDKIAASEGVDGWSKGPGFIIDQAAEEPLDVPGWLKGLDEHPKPVGVDSLVDEIGMDAERLWEKIQRLKGMYG